MPKIHSIKPCKLECRRAKKRAKSLRLNCSLAGLFLLATLAVDLLPARPISSTSSSASTSTGSAAQTDNPSGDLSTEQYGLFADYYDLAREKLDTMTLDEKIAQTLLVRYPDDGVSDLERYQFGGYVFFGKDFQGKTKAEVQALMLSLQTVAKIPLLTAVDEEGGIVSRISNNSALIDQPFRSPQELYRAGGLDAVREDTLQKSAVLSEFGLNLNLAPVVDVSTHPSDYMYSRSLGQDTALTSAYAAAVISASHEHSTSVSYTLKHFPGYGNNTDTHKDTSLDARTYADILRYDLPPFHAGINAGAEAVLVSHNVVQSIDPAHPASLSPTIHQLLRGALGFTGVVITDDLAMGATADIPGSSAQALLAGNDLIITTDYARSLAEIKAALADETLPEATLDQAVLRVLAWKYYKSLFIE